MLNCLRFKLSLTNVRQLTVYNGPVNQTALFFK